MKDWLIRHDQTRFLLKTTPSGQVGVFPEQAENWSWINALPGDLSGLRALNLFGYTGGSTLALAARGAEVVHVDASKSVVNWARQNAALSKMDHLPIRWIVEDATKYVRRAVKRKSRFEILVADPPSFGRGPHGEQWKFNRDIGDWAKDLSRIAATDLRAILLTSHTPGFGPVELQQLVKRNFALNQQGVLSTREMQLRSESGKHLPSGSCFRYHCQ